LISLHEIFVVIDTQILLMFSISED
jgi:hypothetical protein